MNQVDRTHNLDDIHYPDYDNENVKIKNVKINMLIVIDKEDNITIKKQVMIALRHRRSYKPIK